MTKSFLTTIRDGILCVFQRAAPSRAPRTVHPHWSMPPGSHAMSGAMTIVALTTIISSCGGSTSSINSDCYLLAEQYDASCSQDSDCTLVPTGGNICDQCSNLRGCLNCSIATTNQTSAAIYLVKLNSALESYQPVGVDCGIGSCPEPPSAECLAGTCTLVPGARDSEL